MSIMYPTLNSKGISCFPKSQHGAAAGVILFSGFILFDTSNILRNYAVEDYTSATLALYLDLLNLFLFLLRLLSNRD